MSRSALLLSLMMTGCALYVRPMDTLAPNDHVVLELNDQGIPDMAPRLGSGTFLVGGKLQSMDSTALLLSVYRTQSTDALLDTPDPYKYPTYVQWGGETLSVPKFDIASARVERVSGPMVALMALGAIAIGVSTAEVLSHSHVATPTLPPLPSAAPRLVDAAHYAARLVGSPPGGKPQRRPPDPPLPTLPPVSSSITLGAWPR